jgi:hypothetical protein
VASGAGIAGPDEIEQREHDGALAAPALQLDAVGDAPRDEAAAQTAALAGIVPVCPACLRLLAMTAAPA